MQKHKVLVLATMLFGLGTTVCSAASIELYDWNFYVDGTTHEKRLGDAKPTSGALNASGLGTLTWSTSGVGNHTFIAMFDHDIDEAINTFFNEYGSAGGSPALGQTWEIDEPGYVFGDIYTHVLSGVLDSANGIPAGSEDDVSMAIGWGFTLGPGQTAEISLSLSDVLPAEFYLVQTDPGWYRDPFSGDVVQTGAPCTIYFFSNLTIHDENPSAVPEPSTLIMVGTGLAGLVGGSRRKKMAHS